ncbi:MAG: NADH-quinone oxidoreductase subunit L [Puniceicoccaceae bacterium]|nr:MAG: NADH-quinone oxidoreductase subunit L [Puniceicoccaceae bacterium]
MTETATLFLALALIPLPPLAAAAVLLFMPGRLRRPAGAIAVVAQALALFASGTVLVRVVAGGDGFREVLNFTWFQLGAETVVPLGLLVDATNAPVLLMVSLVGLLVFIYSIAYMGGDPRAVRFFCFLSFFSAAMLGLLVANSLLLLFICWELVGLASYLLIGFWFQKPAAARAARKAFIVTRIGDLGLFLGMIWLYREAGTLLFYDGGAGVLETAVLGGLAAGAAGGMTAATAIALLLFIGAAGKSGQVPFHVWLPDAMEGPTPVSALIHAATMVAAGVFLVARAYPLFEASATALSVVAWVGAATALLGACIAVAQREIKRILAYSTVSQLGFMMLSLGVGGPVAALFHLLAHAFFKALLFLGAGSVSHGCGEEKDVLRMGGLGRRMPLTFACYGIGMMALAGFPFFFSGFWSKEAILHAAQAWPVSPGPFWIALAATFLTAFYMSRQMLLVFFGRARSEAAAQAHESPRLMTAPLVILAALSVLPLVVATPAWPWFEALVRGGEAQWALSRLLAPEVWPLLAGSILLVGAGVGLAWWIYHPGRREAAGRDPLEDRLGAGHRVLAEELYWDRTYDFTVVRACRWSGRLAAALDRWIWGGAVALAAALARLFSALADRLDRRGLNHGFDLGCAGLRAGGIGLHRAHRGQLHFLLTTLGVGAVGLLLLLAWL